MKFQIVILSFIFLLVGCAGNEIVETSKSSSNTPFIDKIKGNLKDSQEGGATNEPEESYTARIKKDLKEKETKEGDNSESVDVPESYSAKLKRDFVKTDQSSNAYTEKMKETLGPADKGSAIEALKEGRSNLQPKKLGTIKHQASIKVMATSNLNIVSNKTGRSFGDIYGSDWAPELHVSYDFQPFRSDLLGSVGFGFTTAFGYYNGKGRMKYDLLNDANKARFGLKSKVSFSLISVPVTAFVNYRFLAFKYLCPFAQAGLGVLGLYETRSDEKPSHRGFSVLGNFHLGVNVLLDWMAPGSAWDLYQEWGVHHYYLTLEYVQFATLSGPVAYNPGLVLGGLSYEF